MFKRSIRILLALTLLGLLAAETAAQDTVKLEYKFKPNELRRYKMVYDSMLSFQGSMPGMGEMPCINSKFVCVVRYRTKRVLENGDAEIVTAIESMKMEMMGKTTQMPVDKMPVITMIMSKNGTVKSMDMPKDFSGQALPMQFGDMSKMQVALLPPGAVKLGDSWTQDVPMPGNMGNFRVNSILSQLGGKVGTYDVAVIDQDITGSFSYNGPIPIPGASGASGSPTIDMKFNITGKSANSFCSDIGNAVWTDFTMSMQGTANLQGMKDPQTGANMPVTVNMDMQMFGQMFLLPPQK